MKKIFILLFLLVSILNAKYLVFEDKNNNTTLEYIKNNQLEIFKETKRTSLGAVKHPVWLKIPLVNNTSTNSYKFIRFREEILYKVDVYDDERVINGGSKVPLKQRELSYTPHTYKILVTPNSTKNIFVKIEPRYYVPYVYDIFDNESELISHMYLLDLIFNSFLTVIIFIFIGSVIIFIIFKEKLFFYYSLFVFMSGFFQFFMSGHIQYFYHLESSTFFTFNASLGILITILLFIKTLYKDFIEQLKYVKAIFNTVIFILSAIIFVSLIEINYYIVNYTVGLIEPIIIGLLIIFALYLLVKRVRYYAFVLFGLMVYLVAYFSTLAYYNGYLDFFYSLALFQIASIIEVLSFFCLILYKIYNQIKDEKLINENLLKKQEKLILTKNQLLENIKLSQSVLKIASWKYNIQNDDFWCSEELYSILEVDKNSEKFQTLDDYTKYISSSDAQEFKNIIQVTNIYDEIFQFQYEIMTPTQNQKYMELSFKHIFNEDGSYNYTTGTIQDITTKVLEAKEHEKQQEVMLKQSRFAQMGEMISMIAHQWRQPLNNLSINVTNLVFISKEDPNDESLPEIEHNIYNTIKYMSSTISDFENFFRPNKKVNEFYLKERIESILGLLSNKIKKYSIDVELLIDDKLSLTTFKNEFSQVIIVIIDNAIDQLNTKKDEKYSKKIRIFCEELEDTIKISICDNGGGIPNDIINKVFQPYFSTKSLNGTGVGLYMAKTIVEVSIHGKISVKNNDEGACFVLEIPVSRGVDI